MEVSSRGSRVAQVWGVQGWDAVLLGVEWNTGQEEVVIFPVVPGPEEFLGGPKGLGFRRV